MSKRIVIINPVGFEGGGGTTLCLEYAKLGIDVWFKDYTFSWQEKLNLPDHVNVYTNKEELLNLAKNNDRLLFVNLWFGKTMPDTVLDDIITIRKLYPKVEICYIHCSRRLLDLYKLLPVCQKNNFMFDYIYSLNKSIHTFNYCDSVLMNINAYTLPEYNPVKFSERRKIVFTAGRVEAFKGIVRYFNSIDLNYINKFNNYIYLHEGAKFSYHKNNDGVSCPPQMLSIFDTTQSPKIIKSQFVLKKYGEEPDKDKYNIYPSYNIEDIENRWKYYFAGVCCILGTKSECVKNRTLFGDKWLISDSFEKKIIEKTALLWSDTLEYADLEKMAFGIPLLFSREYSKIIGFNDDRLIYNSFSEIPEKVKSLSNYYDDARESQYIWLNNKLKNVNDNIIKEFTKELY